MKLADCFRKPFNTYADIAGEYHNAVVVEADLDESRWGEVAEVTSVKVAGVERMDDMLQSEVEALDERILAMAIDRLQADYERREDGADFARQVREETIASAQAQRGRRI